MSASSSTRPHPRPPRVGEAPNPLPHKGGKGGGFPSSLHLSWARLAPVLITLTASLLSGCGGELDRDYGRAYSKSINGTGVFADLLKSRNHDVRIARRLTDELQGWADVIVRFSPKEGPPGKDEAEWYSTWLSLKPGRRIVYIPKDYDAEPDYWSNILADLPPDATPRLKTRVEEALIEARDLKKKFPFIRTPPPPPTTTPIPTVAPPEEWFAVKSTTSPPAVCKTLEGLWATGIDAKKAALTVHESLKVDEEVVLLRGDGEPLVMTWTRPNGSRVLVVANACFLLNASLAEPARRPLAMRLASWIGSDESSKDDEYDEAPMHEIPKRIAFVEGYDPLAEAVANPSVFSLLQLSPFHWVAAQLLALGLAACLARAPRLGRAKPEEPTGAERPVAHPEALGSLLARTGQASEARLILETYRRWRTGPSSRGSPKPT